MSSLLKTMPGGPLQLRLESRWGGHILTGEDAMRAAARLMPTVNRFGGSRATVRDAVGLLEEVGDPLKVLTTVQQRHGWQPGDKMWGARSSRKHSWKRHSIGTPDGRRHVVKIPGALHMLAPRERLALEMALHEESERRAMDGELAELEARWREAEQIAKIADDMFVPASIDEELRRRKGERE
jgi:hypothetical protein